MQRGRPINVSRVLIAAAVAGLIAGACASGGAGRCPQRQWCGSAAEAGTVAEPMAGDTFTCPIDLNTGVTIEAGHAPPAGLPKDTRVTLDEHATHRKQNNGEPDTCCYAWTEPCK